MNRSVISVMLSTRIFISVIVVPKLKGFIGRLMLSGDYIFYFKTLS